MHDGTPVLKRALKDLIMTGRGREPAGEDDLAEKYW